MANVHDGESARLKVYEPLDPRKRQIRLLELLPGAGDDLLEGILHISEIPRTAVLVFGDILRRLRRDEDALSQNGCDVETNEEVKDYFDSWSMCIAQCIEWIRAVVDHYHLDIEANYCNLSASDRSYICAVVSITRQILRKVENLIKFACESPRSNKRATFEFLFKGLEADTSHRALLHYEINKMVETYGLSGIDDSTRTNMPWLSSDYSDDITPLTNDGIAFEAVSYCWDTYPQAAEISLSGTLTTAPNSAIVVLRRFRLEHKSRMLWIDAICIDQSNYTEKANQIPLMGDIFRTASCTLAWLGDGANCWVTDAEVIQSCKTLAQSILAPKADPECAEKCRSLHIPEVRLNAICEDAYKGVWSASSIESNIIYDFGCLAVAFERRWFTRSWIYQEIVNSRRIICYLGGSSIEWSELIAIAYYINERDDLLQIYDRYPRRDTFQFGTARANATTPVIVGLASRMKKHEGTRSQVCFYPTLIDLAILSRNLEASDPRDKIYALISMTLWNRCGAKLPDDLRADYMQPVVDCMCKATKAMILETGDLQALNYDRIEFGDQQTAEAPDPEWPSWCPRWDLTESRNYRGLSSQSASAVHACGDLKLDRTVLTRGLSVKVLSLRGFIMDSITECVSLRKSAPAKLSPNCSDVLMLDWAVAEIYHGFRERPKVQLSANDLDCMLMDEARETAEPMTLDPDDIERTWQIMCEYTFFRTQKGYIGSTKGLPMIGDAVTVLFGGAALYLLREKENGYMFIRKCNVHQAMQGEMVKDWKQHGGESVVFELT